MNPRSPSLAAHEEKRRKALAIKKVKRGRERERRERGKENRGTKTVLVVSGERLRALGLARTSITVTPNGIFNLPYLDLVHYSFFFLTHHS